MNTILDSTHFKLRDLENRALVDIYHSNRLKPATVATPCRYAYTQKQLFEVARSDHLPITQQ